jgi:hypothetical protein
MACSGNGYFGEIVCQLETLGLADVLLPFLLLFTIAYAVLQKSKILGEHSHRFNTIVSLVLSMAAVIPHVMNPGSPTDVVIIINKALPNVSLLMIAAMMTLLLIGVFGSDVNVAGTPLAGIVVLFSIIAVGYTFLASAGWVKDIPYLTDPQTRSMLVAVLVFGIIVWFITSEPGAKDQQSGFSKFFEGMGKVMGERKGKT